MKTKVQKWGNSLALRIPRSFAEEAGVRAGSPVEFSVREGALVIEPTVRRRYRLSALMRKVNRRNIHGEVSTGRPVGREVW